MSFFIVINCQEHLFKYWFWKIFIFSENSEHLSRFLSIAHSFSFWFFYLYSHLALRSCQSPHYLLFQPEPLGGVVEGVDICISWVDSSYPALSCALGPRCTDDSLRLIHGKGLLCQKSWMGGRQLFTCQSKQCKQILFSASEPDCSAQLFSGLMLPLGQPKNYYLESCLQRYYSILPE